MNAGSSEPDSSSSFAARAEISSNSDSSGEIEARVNYSRENVLFCSDRVDEAYDVARNRPCKVKHIWENEVFKVCGSALKRNGTRSEKKKF